MPNAAPASSSVVSDCVGVAVALFTVDDRVLRVAVNDGDVPSSAVGAVESLDAAARRTLREGLGIEAPVRQIRAFDHNLDKPAERVIGIGYAALLPLALLRPLASERLKLLELRDGIARGEDGAVHPLPMGEEVVGCALADLRAHLDTTNWAYGLLPEEFTLRELQHAHEAITGRTFNRMAFRKRLLDSQWLESTGRRESDTAYRPAELYRLKPEHARER